MRHVIIIALFLLAANCFGQSNSKKGYIITIESDTLRGELILQSKSKRFRKCTFSKDGVVTEYYPSDILGYRIENELYFISGLLDDSFVEVLVLGESLSLYRSPSQYFLKTSDGRILIMEETREQVGANIIESKKWKGTFYSLVYDCISSDIKREDLRFSEQYLVELVKEYNECKNSTHLVIKEEKKWIRFDIGVQTGVVFSMFKIEPGDAVIYLDDSYSSTDLSVGITLAIVQPRISEQLSLQVGLNYSESLFSSLIEEQLGVVTEYHDSFIQFSTLSLPISLRYAFGPNSFSGYAEIGILFDNYSDIDNGVISERVNSNLVTTSVVPEPFAIPSSQIGFSSAIGVYKRFEIMKVALNVKYEFLPNMVNEVPYSGNLQRFSLNLNLIL